MGGQFVVVQPDDPLGRHRLYARSWALTLMGVKLGPVRPFPRAHGQFAPLRTFGHGSNSAPNAPARASTVDKQEFDVSLDGVHDLRPASGIVASPEAVRSAARLLPRCRRELAARGGGAGNDKPPRILGGLSLISAGPKPVSGFESDDHQFGVMMSTTRIE